MSVRGTLWLWSRWLLAPLGELCCAILLERSLLDPLPYPPNPLDLSIRLATYDDLDLICRVYADDPWLWLGKGPHDGAARGHYRDRLQRGERCYLAFAGGRLAHINWTCSGWGDALPGHPLRLKEGEVYTTDAVTAAEFRGRGVHALVLGRMLSDSRDRGVRHAFTLAQLDRPDAHKGLRALGWRECGRVVYFQPRGSSRALFLRRQGETAPLFRA